mgnify:FL=1|jgi:hypothetical protein
MFLMNLKIPKENKRNRSGTLSLSPARGLHQCLSIMQRRTDTRRKKEVDQENTVTLRAGGRKLSHFSKERHITQI